MCFSKGLEKTVTETSIEYAPVAHMFLGLAPHGYVLSLLVSSLRLLLVLDHDGDQKTVFLRKLH